MKIATALAALLLLFAPHCGATLRTDSRKASGDKQAAATTTASRRRPVRHHPDNRYATQPHRGSGAAPKAPLGEAARDINDIADALRPTHTPTAGSRPIATTTTTPTNTIIAPNTPFAHTTPKMDMISFETHGRDDLRQWRSQFTKGTKVMKVDFNFQNTEAACRSQTRLPPHYNYSNGCFIHIHTFDSAVDNRYNTTYDTVSFFNDDTNVALINSLGVDEQYGSLGSVAGGEETVGAGKDAEGSASDPVPPREPIIIQVSFKNHPTTYCNGPDVVMDGQSGQFITLLDEFYASMQPILRAKYNQTTEMIPNPRNISWATNPPPPRENLGNLLFAFDSFGGQAVACIAYRYWPWAVTFTNWGPDGGSQNTDGNDAYQMINLQFDDPMWTQMGQAQYPMGGVSDTSAAAAAAAVPNFKAKKEEKSLLAPPPPLRRDTAAVSSPTANLALPFYKWNAKYVNASSPYLRRTYPMVSWEPSEELVMELWYGGFDSFDFVYPGGVSQAFNPDPASYNIFTAPLSGRYTHTSFGENQTLTPVTTYAEIAVPTFAVEENSRDPRRRPTVRAATSGKLQGILVTAALLKDDPTTMQVTVHQRTIRGYFQVLCSTLVSSTSSTSFHSTLGHLTSVAFVPAVPATSAQQDPSLVRSEGGHLTAASAVVSTIIVTGATTSLVVLNATLSLNTSLWAAEDNGERYAALQLGADVAVTNVRTAAVTGLSPAPTAADTISFSWIAPVPNHGPGFPLPAIAIHVNKSQTVILSCLDPTFAVIGDPTDSPIGAAKVTVAAGVASVAGGFSFASAVFANATVMELRATLSWSYNHNVYVVVGTRDMLSLPSSSGSSALVFTSPAHMGVGTAPAHSFSVASAESAPTTAPTASPTPASHVLITYGDSFCYNTVPSDDDAAEFNGMQVCDIPNYPFYELLQCAVQSYVFAPFETFASAVAKHSVDPSSAWRIRAMVGGLLDPIAEREVIATKTKELLLSPRERPSSLREAVAAATIATRATTRRLLSEMQPSVSSAATASVGTPINGFANACSDSIFMGNFDVAFNVSAVLLPKGTSDTDIRRNGFLAVAVGTSLTDLSLSECGNPNPQNGRAFVDSFPLFGFFNKAPLAG